MKEKNSSWALIAPVVVLVLIGTIVTTALAVTNKITAPVIAEQQAKAAEAAVKKTLIEAGLIEEEADPNAPVTKGEVQQIVTDALVPMLKAFSLPQNLNNEGQVTKSEQHYLHGLL